ncbi:MAG: hypothetical protein ABSC08_15430 [Bryobacteraceae bacterium]|jgi:hypothetical protein
MSKQGALRGALVVLETRVGVEPKSARRALRGAWFTQGIELGDGGRTQDARGRRKPDLAALATLGAG